MKTIKYQDKEFTLINEKGDDANNYEIIHGVKLQFARVEKFGVVILDINNDFYPELNLNEIKISRVSFTNTGFDNIARHMKNPGGVPGFEG